MTIVDKRLHYLFNHQKAVSPDSEIARAWRLTFHAVRGQLFTLLVECSARHAHASSLSGETTFDDFNESVI